MAERDGTAMINYPAWTEYRKTNGLDPLGMQNSSQRGAVRRAHTVNVALK